MVKTRFRKRQVFNAVLRAGSCALLPILVSITALPAPPGWSVTVTNPHDSSRPDYCLDCHTEDVYRNDCDAPEGFCLLADSVDGLCMLCHVKEDCCRAGQEHQAKLFLGRITHPSGVDAGDISPKYLPRELPTHNGKITCRTCHLHTRQGPESYKMLRIVKREGEEIDWTVLCEDCHEENF